MLQCITIFIVLITGLLYLIHYSIHGSQKGKLIDKIPGPYAWPVIGSIAQFMVPIDELWSVGRRINAKYYPINRIWSANFPAVNIYHPDDVKAVLSSTKNIDKSLIYNFLRPWLGTGLLTSSGAKWHKRRKTLTSAFHFKVLQQFVGIFIEQSEKLADSLCLEGDEVVPDLISLLHKYTLNSICETTMGFTSEVNSNDLNEYRSCVSEMGEISVYRLTKPWMYVDWMFRFFQKFKEQVKILKVLHGFSTNIINERKRYHEETGGRYLEGLDPDSGLSHHTFNDKHVQKREGGNSDDLIAIVPGKGKRRLAMLDLLISAAKREASIDDEGIREEVDTFVFEGHDTAAMALCFTLMLLAENKDIQDKARAESDVVFGERNEGQISLRGLQSLVYLEQCIKESLRLFPSVPFISRYVSEDLQLKNYLVPSGTIVNVFFYELHRDPNFWPNPEVFDPDRFLPDQVKARHPYAFAPFSAGPRNCIGQKFAILELKALVGTFLRNFYLEPIDLTSKVRIRSDIVLRSKYPIRIKLVRRLVRGNIRNLSQTTIGEKTFSQQSTAK